MTAAEFCTLVASLLMRHTERKPRKSPAPAPAPEPAPEPEPAPAPAIAPEPAPEPAPAPESVPVPAPVPMPALAPVEVQTCKVCQECKHWRPVDEFGGADRIANMCQSCRADLIRLLQQ
jgi:hypothetical protein